MNLRRLSACLLPRMAPLLLLAPAVAGLCGCASEPMLTVTSIDHQQCYRQAFTQAFTSKDANGDTNIVLIDRATEQSLSGDKITSPVRQVMHIRMVWTPTHDQKTLAPNAAIKWYVIGCAQHPDILQYTGIAFVNLSEDDTTSTLRIRNAVLKPTGAHGSLTDPVGSSRLEGTFIAHHDRQTVEKVLSDIRNAVATAETNALPLASSGQEK